MINLFPALFDFYLYADPESHNLVQGLPGFCFPTKLNLLTPTVLQLIPSSALRIRLCPLFPFFFF